MAHDSSPRSAAYELFARVKKAVAAAVAAGVGAASVSFQADGNTKTAVVAGVLVALGGFGVTYVTPRNSPADHFRL